MTEPTTTLTLAQALQHGIACHQSGQLPEAERAYRAILATAPQHPDANHNLGVLLAGTARPADALPYFKVALEANPQVEQFWASFAEALLRAGRADHATQLIALARQHGHGGAAIARVVALLEAAALAPEAAPAAHDPLAPAVAAREAGHYQEASEWLGAWLHSHPQDAAALALLAQVLLLNKQDEQAARVLQQAQAIAPDHPDVLRNIVRLLLKRHQPEPALQAAQQLLGKDEHNPETWLVYASALSAQQKDAEALQWIERALEARPPYAEAWASRALVRLRAKDQAGALADIERALSLKPHMAQLWQLAASLHYEANHLPGAIKAMQKALQAEPGNVGFMVGLGEFLRQNGEIAAALALLESAVVQAPDNGAVWVNLGTALQTAQRPAEAKHAYAKALILNPKSAETANNLGALAKNEESWEEALAYFDQALAIRPDHPAILANRASALSALERYEEAEITARRVIGMAPHDIEAHIILTGVLVGMKRYDEAQAQLVALALPSSAGNELRQQWANAHADLYRAQRRWHEAESWLRQSLQIKPADTKVLRQLAAVLGEQNNDSDALATLQQALQHGPADTDTLLALADHHVRREQWPQAEAAARQALAIKQGNVKVLIQLGRILDEQERYGEAQAILNEALQQSPNDTSTLQSMASHHARQEAWSDAERWLRQALALKPTQVEILRQLGATLDQQRRFGEAWEHYAKALVLTPDDAETLHAIATHQYCQERWSEAADWARRALQINPDHFGALMNLGLVLPKIGQYGQADVVLHRVIALKPDHTGALMRFVNNRLNLGYFDELESYLRRAAELNSENLNIAGNLLSAYNSLNLDSTAYRLNEAKRYGAIASRKVTEQLHQRALVTPPQRLRVGLVSGDLRNHPVGYFLEGFLPYIDRSRVEFIAYPTQPKSDELTDRLRSCFTAWTPLYGKSDAMAARQVADDGVHILLDLSGHTDHNRLPLFAWRPAPVQASWLGYFATTGVEQMDFLLGDPHVTPPQEEAHFTERVWRFPESYLCFSPPAVDLEVAPLPALAAGSLTFGCFNNLAKMNDAVVALWARVLLALPTARLFLKTRQLADEQQRQRTMERFAAYGIDAQRLILEGPATRAELLAAYHRVDIALDPFPYPGGTTSAEALWMGVPVLTKRGDSFLSHVGESIAHNAGLPHWIAQDEDDYVTKAVAYATDVAALARLRAGLRAQVLASPLFDAPRFARHFEQALWGMWQHRMAAQEERPQ